MERHVNSGTASSPASPTAFIQADTTTFRDLVQKLTGLAGGDHSEKLPLTPPPRLSSKLSHPLDPIRPRRPSFKLQERRHAIKKLEIKIGRGSLTHHQLSPRHTHRMKSPIPSPVTPLSSEFLFFLGPGTESPSSPAVSKEEKAIAQKGFYLHPSPLTTPRGSDPPELLNLFPLSSPSQRNQD